MREEEWDADLHDDLVRQARTDLLVALVPFGLCIALVFFLRLPSDGARTLDEAKGRAVVALFRVPAWLFLSMTGAYFLKTLGRFFKLLSQGSERE